MGSIITKGRPPVKACGECPHCPAPAVDDVLLYLAADTYEDAGDGTYNQDSILAEAFGLDEKGFSWNVEEDDSACQYKGTSGYYTANARFGVFLKGKLGATATLNIPYTAQSWNCGVYSEEAEAGVISMSFVIEEADIIAELGNGLFMAAYNITSFEEDGEDVTIVGLNDDFMLPAESNTIQRIYNYTFGA